MSDIGRYAAMCDEGFAWCEAESDGDYVRYEDHCAQIAELTAALAEREKALEQAINLTGMRRYRKYLAQRASATPATENAPKEPK